MSLSAKKALHKVPLEIWWDIFSYLPEISLRSLAVGFNKKLPEKQLKHSKAWDVIFKDYDWLTYMVKAGYMPLLVGSGLHYLYSPYIQEGLREGPDEIDIVLLCGEQCSEVKMPSMLFESLKPYISLPERKNLFIIPFGKDGKHKIRLHIGDFGSQCSLDHKRITELGNLFSLKSDGLYSAYLYWIYDRWTLRTLNPEDIVGIGRYASVCDRKTFVEELCGFSIQKPESVPKGKRGRQWLPWQVVFEDPDKSPYDFQHRRTKKASIWQHYVGWEYHDEIRDHEEKNKELWKRRRPHNRKQFYKSYPSLLRR